jgi:thiamine-monophosphate kinase
MLGEFDIIGRYFKRAVRDPSVVLGIGDDAAVLEPGGRIAITVDTLVAGAHFLDGIPPHELGYRSLAVNLSDLAAMGAEPRWCTLALTLPRADDVFLRKFCSSTFGTRISGPFQKLFFSYRRSVRGWGSLPLRPPVLPPE